MNIKSFVVRDQKPFQWLELGKARYSSLGIAAALLAGCGRQTPDLLHPAGPVAAGERLILFNSLAIMLAIVVPTIILTIAFAWWFRDNNQKATYLPEWSFSGRLELLVWSIPALIIVFLGGIAWIGSHELDPPKPLAAKNKPIQVQVVAMDWKWLFIYPEQGVASVNRLVIPAGTPVTFKITSATVMNSFFIPRLGSQIYAMSGMTTSLNLMADRPGTFNGLSAHYSGRGFPGMAFKTEAIPAPQFREWIRRSKSTGPALDGQHYVDLMKDSVDVKPYTYRSVPASLFNAIVQNSGTENSKVAIDGRER